MRVAQPAPAVASADPLMISVRSLYSTLTPETQRIALIALGNIQSIEQANPSQALECLASLIAKNATPAPAMNPTPVTVTPPTTPKNPF